MVNAKFSDVQYVTCTEETAVLITWSKWNWYDVKNNGAREIYNDVKVMFAPPVEETAGGLLRTRPRPTLTFLSLLHAYV